jgi:hypothetical protein
MNMNFRKFIFAAVAAAVTVTGVSANAAQLSGDAKSAIPYDVQQLIAMDYRAMENSPVAMSMKSKLMPPELKSFELALNNSGLDVSRDVDVLVFAAIRSKVASSNADGTLTLGIAQGQFQTTKIMANFTKQKIKPTMIRTTAVYPLGSAGMGLVFLNPSTMLFGSKPAMTAAIDARDGLQPNVLSNSTMMDSMNAVDSEAIWSLLDAKGSQVVLKSLLGEAAGLADFDTVKQRLQGARYTMGFSNGVRFKMDVLTGDPISAAGMSTLLQGAVLYKKTSGTDVEKQALNATTVSSSGDILTAEYRSSDDQFNNLLQSSLFQSVVK